jgi:hypothetical protein
MKRDWTMRNNRMVHRFGPDESAGDGAIHGPIRVIGTVGFAFNGTGVKEDTFELPLPKGIAGGCSRAITAADGAGGAWSNFDRPASLICKPNKKGYAK